MKEKILQELKTRAAKSGCSERTIQAYVDNVALPTEESALTEEFYSAHVNVLKAIGGQMNRDIAEQVGVFKKNLKPEPNPPSPISSEPDNPAAQIAAELKSIRDRLDREDKEKARKSMLSEVEKIMDNKGATNQHLRNLILRNVQIDEEDTVQSLVERYIPEYNDLNNKLYGSSAATPGAGGAPHVSQTAFDSKAEIERLRKEGLLPSEGD